MEHHDGVISGLFADEFPEEHSQELRKQAFITVEEATEAYMLEVIPASQCLK
jgi:hypothetical protein